MQCGAFLDERHASALKDKLEAAGFPAIVKYGELLYHVQCGAFSKRENAERLKAKLASRGFSCIIKREKSNNKTVNPRAGWNFQSVRGFLFNKTAF